MHPGCCRYTYPLTIYQPGHPEKDVCILDCCFLWLAGIKGLFEAVLFDCKKENIEKIPSDLPILLISGEDDPVGGLGKGVRKVEALLRETGHTDVVCKLYPGARHEVLNEINYDEVYRDILDWLTKNESSIYREK